MSSNASAKKRSKSVVGLNEFVWETSRIIAEQLRVSRFNPPQRTSDRAIVALKQSIAEHGILTPMLVIGNRSRGYDIVDGHRRFAAGLSIGLTEFKCEVADAPIEMAPMFWACANKDTRHLNTAEWSQAWFLEPRLSVPPRIASNIAEVVRIFGSRDSVDWLLKNKSDPSVVIQTKMLHRALVSKSSLRDVPSEKSICEWIVRHRVRGLVAQVIKLKVPIGLARKFLSRIRNDQPFTVMDI